MTNTSTLPRGLIVFGILVPLALLLGYLLATPTQFSTMAVIMLVVGVLLTPVFLHWHHLLLIISWYAVMNLAFLPGRPRLWMLFAVISLGISMVSRLLDKQRRFLYTPGVTWTLIAFAGVVIVTMIKVGQFGVAAVGSGSYGGRRYIELLVAIIGYFALTAQPIPPKRAVLYASLFLLSGVTAMAGDIVYLLGPAFYWFFWVLPVDYAATMAAVDFSGDTVRRAGGFAFACLGPYLFLLARYGMRGILDLAKPWRLMLLLLCFGVSLVGGFRSIVALMALVVAVQFWLEGLWRTRFLPVAVVGILLLSGVVVGFIDKMPLSVQRSLSFLPLNVDPVAKYAAEASTQWRLEMWKLMLPHLSEYLVMGKGYVIDPTELYLATQAVRQGLIQDIDVVMLVGDYHNGFLSLYVPFGSLGVLAFIAFLVSAWRVLYRNFRFGDGALRTINTLLFAYFITRIVFFVVVFGAISNDLAQFVGLVGLSVALNGGVRRAPATATELQTAPIPLALAEQPAS